ncbi:hypothetical protein EDC45_0383 [Mesocricetibacter intestinalis]|uniref:Uncharacterized protein n=1 Tax=Mesocricetibacter intestinalis TaxID=1521930 RepID=A0A4R6VCR0_9PAST|nr:DUF2063 domain-containing protein [Mesocricetibacter intestinalis]TDQ59724.1 hypothetical protein EDC45_0383 [Mesocricetibacter intestinalis]
MRPSLIQTQNALARAVRLADAQPLGNYAPNRLAVYARLVRNNTFGFIDRCFVEAPQHIPAEDWQNTKERFLREARAVSPYFQDIAGEFLAFCQAIKAFEPHILALMDFENTQLLAEVAMADVPDSFAWDEGTRMRLSEAAFLKEYDVDFIHSDFTRFEAKATKLAVWRDSLFAVRHQGLTELDFWLLTYLGEQAASLQEIEQALSAVIAENQGLSAVLQQTWEKWIEEDVIYPLKV